MQLGSLQEVIAEYVSDDQSVAREGFTHLIPFAADVGFLGAAQIDRFGNLNTTAIKDYTKPRTRLPGAGAAPEIAHHAKPTFGDLHARTRRPTQ